MKPNTPFSRSVKEVSITKSPLDIFDPNFKADAFVNSIGNKYELGGMVWKLLCQKFHPEKGEKALKTAIEKRIIEMMKLGGKEDLPKKLYPGNYIYTGGGESDYSKIFSKFRPILFVC